MPGTRITCPHCDRTLKLKAGKELSKTARCPGCNGLLRKSPANGSGTSPQLVQNLLLGAIAVGLFVIGGGLLLNRNSGGNSAATPVANNAEPPSAEAASTSGAPSPKPSTRPANAIEVPTSHASTSSTPAPIESKELRATAPSAPPFEPRFRFRQQPQTLRYTIDMNVKYNSLQNEASTMVDLREIENRGTERALALMQESSGTAFGVTADGYMLTCAHVVENAYEIEVTLGDNTFPARVVNEDEINDLAILKIDVENLPVIPLELNTPAQLGQDIRAIGYPLSDLLGQDVKVTRGTITGGIGNADDPRLQIDATINPGNSGGPIVDSYGNVVGVASAKLAGVFLSDVGLCVPTRTASELLSSSGVEISAEAQRKGELSGPNLVQKVSQAVGFVKVKAGPDTSVENVIIDYTSSFSDYYSSSRPRDIPKVFVDSLPAEGAFSAFLRSETGKLYDRPADRQFPFLVGSPLKLIYFETPAAGVDEWTTAGKTAVYRMKSRPSIFGLQPGDFSQTEATETANYKIIREDAKEVEIERNYLIEAGGPEENYHMEMKGRIVFDKLKEAISTINYSGTFSYNLEGSRRAYPFTLTGKIFDTALVEKRALEKMRADEELLGGELENYTATKIETGKYVTRLIRVHPRKPFLAVGKTDNKIRIYNHSTGELVSEAKVPMEHRSLTAIELSPDGDFLLAGTSGGAVDVFGLSEDGELSLEGAFHGHSRQVEQIVISPSGRLVLSVGSTKKVRCWTLSGQNEKFTTPAFAGLKVRLQFIDENNAWMCDGKHLQKWDLSRKKGGRLVQIDKSSGTGDIRFSPSGDVVFQTKGYDIRRWSTATGQELPQIETPGLISVAEFVGDQFVTGNGGRLTFWNAEGKAIGFLRVEDTILSIETLAVNQNDGSIACALPEFDAPLWYIRKSD